MFSSTIRAKIFGIKSLAPEVLTVLTSAFKFGGIFEVSFQGVLRVLLHTHKTCPVGQRHGNT
jgi:hypothetical protein